MSGAEQSSARFQEQPPPDTEITEIIPGFLFLGSNVAANNSQLLQSRKITHILNMAKECPNYFQNDANSKYIYKRADLDDIAFEDFGAFIAPGIRFIEDARKKLGRVLIHCVAGVSRSGSMAVAYIMYNQAKRLDDAIAFVKSKRPIVDITTFYPYLMGFQEYLNEKNHFDLYQLKTSKDEIFVPEEIDEKTRIPAKQGAVPMSESDIAQKPVYPDYQLVIRVPAVAMVSPASEQPQTGASKRQGMKAALTVEIPPQSQPQQRQGAAPDASCIIS